VAPFILILGLGVALLETVLVYKAVQNTARARLLAGLPWSKLGQMRPGLVKVRGRVYALRDFLRSPLADRDCVYFHFKVQEKRHRAGGPHGGGGSYWKTVINDAQLVPCAIDDGTGSAAVRLQSAELVLRPGESERSGFLNSARPELEAMLQQRYGYSSVGLIFSRALYFSEARIEEGDALVVLGTARQAPDGGWELLRGPGPLLVTDRDLAGILASYRGTASLWWPRRGCPPYGARNVATGPAPRQATALPGALYGNRSTLQALAMGPRPCPTWAARRRPSRTPATAPTSRTPPRAGRTARR
jgi:hypothetical protein